MSQEQVSDTPQVLFRLGDQLLAIDSLLVQEMIAQVPVTDVPHTPASIRGVFNLRGQVMPLVDLRVKFGLQSFGGEVTELIEILKLREQDHHNWIAELENSVREKRPFTLQRDPERCGFGLWYGTFKTNHELLSRTLEKFDAPHRRIHALAAEVEKHCSANEHEQALALIAREKNATLSELVKHFERTRELLEKSMVETILVLSWNGFQFGVTADRIESVEMLDPQSIEEVPDMFAHLSEEIAGLAKRAGTGDITLLIDVSSLVPSKALDNADEVTA